MTPTVTALRSDAVRLTELQDNVNAMIDVIDHTEARSMTAATLAKLLEELRGMAVYGLAQSKDEEGLPFPYDNL